MLKKDLIKTTEKFVKERLKGADPGHDFFHIQRVRNNAKLINEKEHANSLIIDLASLLHDVGDRKIIKQECDDYSIARNFLLASKIDRKTADAVMFVIENMSFSKTLNSKVKNAPKELYVVQDADRMDAIGAIGIARTFAFGGSLNRPMYDPRKQAQKIHNSKNYKKMESSTFHHFEEKLFLLKNLMNTKTAKNIAVHRHKFMKSYLEEFLAEWYGKR
jgi:uncharacterized protein